MPRQVVVLTATKMADGSSLKYLWPVELQLLEAEYENSKLQVRLDTLECHKSIAELDVLCQEETLRKKKRENNELSKYRNGLEEKLRVSESQIEDVQNRLREANRIFEDERLKSEEEREDHEEKRTELTNSLHKNQKEWLKEKKELEKKITSLQDGKEKYLRERKVLEAEKSGISSILQVKELEWSKEKKELEDRVKYLQEKVEQVERQQQKSEEDLKELQLTLEDERMKNGKERTVLETENVEKSKLLKEKEAEWLREKKELEKQIKCWQEKHDVAVDKFSKIQTEREQRKKRLKQKGTQASLESVDATTSTSVIEVPPRPLLVDTAVQVDLTTAHLEDKTESENLPHSRATAVCELSVLVERINPCDYKVLAPQSITQRNEQQDKIHNRKQKNSKQSPRQALCGEDDRGGNNTQVSCGEVLPKKKKGKQGSPVSSGLKNTGHGGGQEKLLAPRSSMETKDRQPKQGKGGRDKKRAREKLNSSEDEGSENWVQKKRTQNFTVSRSSQDDGLPCDDSNERSDVACERDPCGSETDNHTSSTGPRGQGRPDKGDDRYTTQTPQAKDHSNKLDDMQVQCSDKNISENVNSTNKVSDLSPTETGLILNGEENTVNRPSKRPHQTTRKNAKVSDTSHGKKEVSSRETRAQDEFSTKACLDNSVASSRQNVEVITVSQQDSFGTVARSDNEAPDLQPLNKASDSPGMKQMGIGTAKAKEIKRSKKKTVAKENANKKKQEKPGVASRNKRKSSCDVGSDTTVVNGTVAAGNDVSTLLNGTCRKRRMLFNRNDNSLATVSFMPQASFLNNTTFSRSRLNNSTFSRSRVSNLPPSLSRFMQSFIAPKLKKNTSMSQKNTSVSQK